MSEPAQISLLRQMREIVRSGQNSAPEHPHRIGMDLLNKNDFAGAATAFRAAIEQNPNFSFSQHGLGEALFHSAEKSEAETVFRRAVELNPHYAPSFAFLGEIQTEKGNFLEAEQLYRQSLKLQPENVFALKGLARTLLKNARNAQSEAADLLKKAYKARRDDPDILANLLDLQFTNVDFCVQVADDLTHDNSLQKAVFFYHMALRYRPDSKIVWLKLANVLQDIGNGDAVGECLRHADALAENTWETFELLGILLTKQDSLTEAIAAYRRASELDPTNAQLHKTIGDLLARQNQLSDANAAYQRALELGFVIY